MAIFGHSVDYSVTAHLVSFVLADFSVALAQFSVVLAHFSVVLAPFFVP